MQDALFEAWRDLATFPADKSKARFEMFRVASRVAQRYRRRAAKTVYVDELEVRDSRDIEAWIAARVLWLEALGKLDDSSRDLIIAYHIDGRTYKQIGAELGEKEDTTRRRIARPLRVEPFELLNVDPESNDMAFIVDKIRQDEGVAAMVRARLEIYGGSGRES